MLPPTKSRVLVPLSWKVEFLQGDSEDQKSSRESFKHVRKVPN